MQMDASGRQEEQYRLKKRSLGSETEQSGKSLIIWCCLHDAVLTLCEFVTCGSMSTIASLQ